MQNFFAKGNLTALRELALRAPPSGSTRRCVAHMRRHAISGPWPTQERILVCINECPGREIAGPAAKRMADRARVGWIALNVVSAATETLSEADKDRRTEALRLAEPSAPRSPR